MALGTLSAEEFESGPSIGTSGSFTVPAGDTLYAILCSGRHSSLPSAQAISDSEGLTWTAAIDATFSGTRYARIQVWRATSNGDAMTVTITPGAVAPDRCGLQILGISGASANVSNSGSAGHGSGDPAPSLTRMPPAGNIVVGAFLGAEENNAAPPAGFTNIRTEKMGGSDDWLMQICFDATPAQSASWTTGAKDALAVLIEIKAKRPRSFATMVG